MSLINAILDEFGMFARSESHVSNVEVADLRAELHEAQAQRDRYKQAYEYLRDMIRDIKIHEL